MDASETVWDRLPMRRHGCATDTAPGMPCPVTAVQTSRVQSPAITARADTTRKLAAVWGWAGAYRYCELRTRHRGFGTGETAKATEEAPIYEVCPTSDIVWRKEMNVTPMPAPLHEV